VQVSRFAQHPRHPKLFDSSKVRKPTQMTSVLTAGFRRRNKSLKDRGTTRHHAEISSSTRWRSTIWMKRLRDDSSDRIPDTAGDARYVEIFKKPWTNKRAPRVQILVRSWNRINQQTDRIYTYSWEIEVCLDQSIKHYSHHGS